MSDKIHVAPKSGFAHSDKAERAIRRAVREAILDHKRAENPVAVWENGKVKIVPPEEIELRDETE